MSQCRVKLSDLTAKKFILKLLNKPTSTRRIALLLLTSLALNAACGIAAEPTATEPVSVVSPIAPSSSQEEVPPIGKPTGKLSPRLQMLAESDFSQQDAEAQAQALSLPVSGPGSLMKNDNGELLVRIRLSDTSEENQQALVENGADIVNIAEAYRTITAYVAPENLSNLADLAFVENIQEELEPQR